MVEPATMCTINLLTMYTIKMSEVCTFMQFKLKFWLSLFKLFADCNIVFKCNVVIEVVLVVNRRVITLHSIYILSDKNYMIMHKTKFAIHNKQNVWKVYWPDMLKPNISNIFLGLQLLYSSTIHLWSDLMRNMFSFILSYAWSLTWVP